MFQYLDAVVREGSLRRAANKCFVTASALDRRVQDLEAEIGTPLFERHARGMRLTAAGEIYLAYARRLMADTQRALSEIDHLKGLRRGNVSLAISPAMAFGFAPYIIRIFSAKYPGVSLQVQVVSHDVALRYLLSFDVDLAIIISRPNNNELVDLVTIDQPLMAIVDKKHPLATKDCIRLTECLEYPLILPGKGLTTREMLDTKLQNIETVSKQYIETNSYEVMRNLVFDSLNIGFGIFLQIQSPSRGVNEHITHIPISEKDIRPVPIICVQLRNRSLSVPAAQLANLVTQELGKFSSR